MTKKTYISPASKHIVLCHKETVLLDTSSSYTGDHEPEEDDEDNQFTIRRSIWDYWYDQEKGDK